MSLASLTLSLLTASTDCKINLYEIAADGDETLVGSVLAHYKPILAASWVNGWSFLPKSLILLDASFVTGGRDGSVKLWDTRTKTVNGEQQHELVGKPNSQISGKQQSFAISCHGDNVAVGEEDGISFYDFRKTNESVARIVSVYENLV